ncbi:MAG: hypothetical protein H8E14_10535 [Candidatus Marinimicrobia bacterium]|nr:hypothetical protein [Candidatus Neomarinimicrobiota bacterium]
MKHKIILMTIILTGLVFGKSLTLTFIQTLADVEKLYARQLRTCEMSTMTESLLYCSVRLKAQFPDHNFNQIVREVKWLAKKGCSPEIRYKANLVIISFAQPKKFRELNAPNVTDGPEFWSTLVASI